MKRVRSTRTNRAPLLSSGRMGRIGLIDESVAANVDAYYERRSTNNTYDRPDTRVKPSMPRIAWLSRPDPEEGKP